jgi:hypothetical protein
MIISTLNVWCLVWKSYMTPNMMIWSSLIKGTL